jgi:two-component system response regulator
MLLDLNLPRKSGIEVLTELRRDDELRNLPVYVLTTSNYLEDQDRVTALGVSSFLIKPTDLRDFESMIKELVTCDFPKAVIRRSSSNAASQPGA